MGNVCAVQLACGGLSVNLFNCTNELEANLDALPAELEELIATRDDVLRRVVIAEQQRKEPTEQVKSWLSRVQDVEDEATELQFQYYNKIGKLCLGGYCSRNCKSTYQFRKRVANRLQMVTMLKAEGDFQDVGKQIPEDPAYELPLHPLIVGQQSILDEVLSCLNEDPVGIIGLYGLGGVGKTTLLAQINNSFCNQGHHFDFIIWTVVSKDSKHEKIQDDIGRRIGLVGEYWRQKHPEEKARDIFHILNKKKFVLLLDDIWEPVDLIRLGVPPTKGLASKVVFTTRFLDVCGQMEADKRFEVKCLEEEEAWKLFQNKVGSDTLNGHPEIAKLAEMMAKECRGLPLALTVVGRAMASKKTLQEWEYAVEALRKSAFKFPGLARNVYPLLKFSYDSLPCGSTKSCFLYCSLFPEDYRIDQRYLIECWLAEGFLSENDGIGAINRGYAIIGDLVRASLLLEEDDYVIMHDVVRDMALWIAGEIEKENENFLVQAGIGINRAPQIEKWKGVRRISLMKNQIENLLDTPYCLNLQTLFLGYNKLLILNSNFFQFMPSLKVLNLSHNFWLKELPSGISNLVSLEHLDISFTALHNLPEEMKELVNLKYLSVERLLLLRTFPRQILSSLSMLRTLKMMRCGSFHRQTEDSLLFDGGESLIEELLYLEHLNTLDVITLRNARALQKFSSSQKLQRCCLSLRLEGIKDSKSLDILSLADSSSTQRRFHGFQGLHTVIIYSCPELKDMTWLSLAPNLKEIEIFDCIEMEEIINVEKLVKIQDMLGHDRNPLAKLESLDLRSLPNLKSIYWSALPLLGLKEIFVVSCPQLKKLPLDSNSARERKIVIKGEKKWWNELQWENEASQKEFGSCFESVYKDEQDEVDGH